MITLDLSARKLTSVYDQPTRTYGVQLMGLRDHHLFVSLPGTSPPLHELAEMFRAATLPRAQWTHLAHLRVGAWHVHHFGATQALVRLRHGIRALNVANGVANTPTGGYHETITAAYVTLIAAWLGQAAEPAASLALRVERMLAGPMAERTLLLRFWSQETLMSPAARAAWVPPDRAPLALPL